MIERIQEYVKLKKESSKLEEKLHEISKRKYNLDKQFERYIFEHNLYEPIEKITEHSGVDIASITVIYDDGSFDNWYYDTIEVVDGHLYVNDENGIIEYDEKTGLYHTHCWGVKSEGEKIVGYINLIEDRFLTENDTPLDLYEIVLCSQSSTNKSIESEG